MPWQLIASYWSAAHNIDYISRVSSRDPPIRPQPPLLYKGTQVVLNVGHVPIPFDLVPGIKFGDSSVYACAMAWLFLVTVKGSWCMVSPTDQSMAPRTATFEQNLTNPFSPIEPQDELFEFIQRGPADGVPSSGDLCAYISDSYILAINAPASGESDVAELQFAWRFPVKLMTVYELQFPHMSQSAQFPLVPAEGLWQDAQGHKSSLLVRNVPGIRGHVAENRYKKCCFNGHSVHTASFSTHQIPTCCFCAELKRPILEFINGQPVPHTLKNIELGNEEAKPHFADQAAAIEAKAVSLDRGGVLPFVSPGDPANIIEEADFAVYGYIREDPARILQYDFGVICKYGDAAMLLRLAELWTRAVEAASRDIRSAMLASVCAFFEGTAAWRGLRTIPKLRKLYCSLLQNFSQSELQRAKLAGLDTGLLTFVAMAELVELTQLFKGPVWQDMADEMWLRCPLSPTSGADSTNSTSAATTTTMRYQKNAARCYRLALAESRTPPILFGLETISKAQPKVVVLWLEHGAELLPPDLMTMAYLKTLFAHFDMAWLLSFLVQHGGVGPCGASCVDVWGTVSLAKLDRQLLVHAMKAGLSACGTDNAGTALVHVAVEHCMVHGDRDLLELVLGPGKADPNQLQENTLAFAPLHLVAHKTTEANLEHALYAIERLCEHGAATKKTMKGGKEAFAFCNKRVRGRVKAALQSCAEAQQKQKQRRKRQQKSAKKLAVAVADSAPLPEIAPSRIASCEKTSTMVAENALSANSTAPSPSAATQTADEQCRARIRQLLLAEGLEATLPPELPVLLDADSDDDEDSIAPRLPEPSAQEEEMTVEEATVRDQAAAELRAGLCLGDAASFENETWEVECTKPVWDALLDHKRPQWLRFLAMRKIQKLATGFWDPAQDAKRTQGASKLASISLFEARFNKYGRILWQRAIAFSPRKSNVGAGSKIYSEVIRVWAIVFDHDRLSREIDMAVGRAQVLDRELDLIVQQQIVRIGASLSKGENASFKRYVDPPRGTQKVKGEAMQCIPTVYSVGQKGHDRAMCLHPPANPEEKSFTVEKLYAVDSNVVGALLRGVHSTAVDFPFLVTDEEDQIIRIPMRKSMLLLGRSGTGKTTCLLYRLWRDMLSYWSTQVVDARPTEVKLKVNEVLHEKDRGPAGSSPMNEDEPAVEHLRTIFITKNRVLLHEVRRRFIQCVRGSDETNRAYLQRARRPTLGAYADMETASSSPFPLFLSGKDWLNTLDATYGGDDYGRCFFARNPQGVCIDDVRSGGSVAFEQHETTALHSESESEDENAGTDGQPNVRRGRQRLQMDFECFVHTTFPAINKPECFPFDPTFVWIEINSYIKGSLKGLLSENGHLALEEYEHVGRKRAPHFTKERVNVHELFLRYQRWLLANGYFDTNDLVRHVYLRVEKAEPSITIHGIFVDEVQDFTVAELALLIRTSTDPNRLFLAGDTAQCIARGVGFRFQDLRELFHHFSEQQQDVGGHWKAPVMMPEKPTVLQHNYRSHGGIMNLAASVIDILSHHFPATFDVLERDRSLFPGPLPILFTECNFVDLAVTLSAGKHAGDNASIDFGAKQVIIVPTDEAKASIPAELLLLNNCLTLEEAKGLEFEQVLMLNFFSMSSAAEEWRVVTTYLEDKFPTARAQDLPGVERCRTLPFDPDQHKVLSAELKFLYTAITRARTQLWIADVDVSRRGPVFEYWTSRNLVHVHDTSSEDTRFGDKEESTPKEWEQQARYFYEHKLYMAAAKCWKRAGNEQLYLAARARELQLLARKARLKKEQKRSRELLLEAADCHVRCGELDKAADALRRGKEYALAGMAFKKLGQPHKAAKAFAFAGRHREAATMFAELGQHTDAIECLTKGRLFLRACTLVQALTAAKQSKLSTIHSLESLSIKAAEQAIAQKDEASLKHLLATFFPEKAMIDFCRKVGRAPLVAEILMARSPDDHEMALKVAMLLRESGKHPQAYRISLLPLSKKLDFIAEELRFCALELRGSPHGSSARMTSVIADAQDAVAAPDVKGSTNQVVQKSWADLSLLVGAVKRNMNIVQDVLALILAVKDQNQSRRFLTTRLLLSFGPPGVAVVRKTLAESTVLLGSLAVELFGHSKCKPQDLLNEMPRRVQQALSFYDLKPAPGKSRMLTGEVYGACQFLLDFVPGLVDGTTHLRLKLDNKLSLQLPTQLAPPRSNAYVSPSAEKGKFLVSIQDACYVIADAMLDILHQCTCALQDGLEEELQAKVNSVIVNRVLETLGSTRDNKANICKAFANKAPISRLTHHCVQFWQGERPQAEAWLGEQASLEYADCSSLYFRLFERGTAAELLSVGAALQLSSTSGLAQRLSTWAIRLWSRFEQEWRGGRHRFDLALVSIDVTQFLQRRSSMKFLIDAERSLDALYDNHTIKTFLKERFGNTKSCPVRAWVDATFFLRTNDSDFNPGEAVANFSTMLDVLLCAHRHRGVQLLLPSPKAIASRLAYMVGVCLQALSVAGSIFTLPVLQDAVQRSNAVDAGAGRNASLLESIRTWATGFDATIGESNQKCREFLAFVCEQSMSLAWRELFGPTMLENEKMSLLAIILNWQILADDAAMVKRLTAFLSATEDGVSVAGPDAADNRVSAEQPDAAALIEKELGEHTIQRITLALNHEKAPAKLVFDVSMKLVVKELRQLTLVQRTASGADGLPSPSRRSKSREKKKKLLAAKHERAKRCWTVARHRIHIIARFILAGQVNRAKRRQQDAAAAGQGNSAQPETTNFTLDPVNTKPNNHECELCQENFEKVKPPGFSQQAFTQANETGFDPSFGHPDYGPTPQVWTFTQGGPTGWNQGFLASATDTLWGSSQSQWGTTVYTPQFDAVRASAPVQPEPAAPPRMTPVPSEVDDTSTPSAGSVLRPAAAAFTPAYAINNRADHIASKEHHNAVEQYQQFVQMCSTDVVPLADLASSAIDCLCAAVGKAGDAENYVVVKNSHQLPELRDYQDFCRGKVESNIVIQVYRLHEQCHGICGQRLWHLAAEARDQACSLRREIDTMHTAAAELQSLIGRIGTSQPPEEEMELDEEIMAGFEEIDRSRFRRRKGGRGFGKHVGGKGKR